MRRTLVTILVLGLVAGALALPADAKKKKKKQPPLVASELKYFLHWEADGATPEGCTGPRYLSLEDKSGDTTCNFAFQPAQEVLAATGQNLLVYDYAARDGVPFVVDASRKITGQIVLRGTFTVQAYAELVLNATVGGAQKTLAEGRTPAGNGVASGPVQGQQLPGPAAMLPVELEIDKALDKLEVTALMLEVTVRGIHRGGIDYEVTPSHVIVPAFVRG